MSHFIRTWALACATLLAASTTIAGTVDQTVNDCVYASGVRGSYHVTPTRIGSTAAYTVPPGGDVSTRQSAAINACITRALQGQPRRTAAPARNATVDTCLADYQHKLRTTRNGRDYRGNNAGTRLVSGLFGRNMGRNLIEHEYDRCLNQIAYYNDRCPTGVFVSGGGYCIKRPTR